MSKKVLTDKFIKSRKAAPKGRRHDYHDAIVPGLALRVTDTGHKSFVLHSRFPARPDAFTRRALGDYGAIELDVAREKARGWLALIQQGKDPRIEEARQRAQELRRLENSFAAVAAQFIERHVRGPAYAELERLASDLRQTDTALTEAQAMARVKSDPRYRTLVDRSDQEGLAKKDEAVRVINAEFVKRWGDRPIGDVLPEEVAAAIRAIVARGAPYQAHNAFGYLRRLFSWAIGTNEFGLLSSPAEQFRPDDLIGTRREPRLRVLMDAELNEIWAASGAAGYPYGPLLRILILTGQRKSEVAEMQWTEIEMAKKLWTVPQERMKGRRSHEVPLAPKALEVLDGLPRFNGGRYVFTTTNGAKPVNGFSKAKRRVDVLIAKSRAKLKIDEVMLPWVIHDLRRTVRTHLSALPVEDLVRELVIAHAKPGLHKVYDQHRYREEKRLCLELWEDRLLGILGNSTTE